MAALPKKQWTVEDYLAFERSSEDRHEYLNGEIYLMTGASRNHNLIVLNTAASLHSQLRDRPCEIYASDMRVRTGQRGYVYPDVVVVRGEPQLEDGELDTLLNPTVIIEVLSSSTEQYDRGQKFHQYRALPSVQEYVLIAQELARIEVYRRQEQGQWLYTATTTPDDLIELTSIDAKLSLTDVYARVTFTET